jgi:hypothetical protein
MLKLCIALLSTGLLTAPTHSFPNTSKKHSVNRAPFDKSPKKKPGKKSKPGHQPTDFKPGDYQGTISTISVDRNGKVREIYFKLAGNVRTILIDGCGMKTADHPLLLWAFTEKRLLYIGTDDNRCFARMSLKKP